MQSITFTTEDVLDLALRYEATGSLDGIIFFASELLGVTAEDFYDMLEEYRNR